MGLITKPPAIITPVDVEDFGAPELFATGWALHIGPEVVSTVAYVERPDMTRMRHIAVVRVYYPRSLWHRSLDMTMAAIRAGRLH